MIKKLVIAVVVFFLMCAFLSASENYPNRIVLFFHADWCSACKTMEPHWETKAINDILNQQGYYFASIDTDKYQIFAKQRGVRAIPVTTITEYNPKTHEFGDDIKSQVGAMNLSGLEDFLTNRE